MRIHNLSFSVQKESGVVARASLKNLLPTQRWSDFIFVSFLFNTGAPFYIIVAFLWSINVFFRPTVLYITQTIIPVAVGNLTLWADTVKLWWCSETVSKRQFCTYHNLPEVSSGDSWELLGVAFENNTAIYLYVH